MPYLFLALTAAFAATPAAAQPFQSTQLLDTLVAQFTGHDIGEVGGARAPVDVRLKLAACAGPQLEWHTEAKQAVVVRCMNPEWKIYVAVNAPPPPPRAATPPPVAPAAQPAAPVVTPPARPEFIIRRGDTVTLEAGAPGFSITREGTAMGDAPLGGRVMIRVDDKRPPIQAIADAPGHARLPGSGD